MTGRGPAAAPRRLAFLGPPGTFTEEAALAYARTLGAESELAPLPSITAVATAVDSGMADEGIVPIENSLEGSVSETLDLLVHSPNPLAIRSELVLPIDHYLLARPDTKPEQVKVIHAHPQALGQCRSFIERCFPKARIEAALSNAAAVEEAMKDPAAAAIGPARAAEIYGAQVLARRIQDRNPNLTRFVVLAHEDHPPTGRDKTSIAFAFATEDRPGLLVGALQEFAARSINLSKIESRPSKEKLGAYIFVVDIDGHRTEPAVAEALSRVQELCSSFRVLGSYPRWG
jgi:prephenate dehydratase